MSDSNPALSLGGWWPIAGEHQGGGALARLNPSAAFGNAAVVQIGPAPIPPAWTGRKVTATVLTATARASGAEVGIRWLDAAGGPVGATVWSTARTGMDGLRRLTVTGTPPAGAVACRVGVYYAEVIAQPQVTWTDSPTEWDVGAGVDQVVITNLSRSILNTRGNQVLHDISFTAQEVGP